MELKGFQQDLVCATGRPYHSYACLKFAFHGSCPPFIPLPTLRELLTDFIYNQFLCFCPMSQSKSDVHRCRSRTVTFYWHCHCNSPNSLQCKALKEVAKKVFYSFPFTLKNTEKLNLIPICCNSWTCVPFRATGYIITRSAEHFFFLMEDKFCSELQTIACHHDVKIFPFKTNCAMIMVTCTCGEIESCVKSMNKLMNCLRMIISCSVDDLHR
ncbi:E4.2 [Lizard adenovirus 2]|uniref:E4.2 n=1 Tax=Lizard adenovirus 2 TaxID=874272 RepID=A0A076FT40_9ADEN|nr:E4.2 [Lizard adenovirus 2]AII22582.1 E4.2 [Lizard adenovirus 2]